ncbi:MAG: QueT transporter family protein [Candidatus Bathyarchaeia archaeon]
MKFGSKELALTAIFTAVYAVLVLALAGISFQLVQVRVADALIPLSMVFGWPAVIGVTLGSVVANVASPMPSILADVTFGSLANLLAGVLAWKLGQYSREFLGCVVATAVITFIVGTYLAVLTEMEMWIWWLGIGIGSVISINVLGYFLVKATKKLLAE